MSGGARDERPTDAAPAPVAVGQRPLAFQVERFCDEALCAHLLAQLDPARLAAAGVAVEPGSGPAGRTARVPFDLAPALADVAQRIDDLVGVGSGTARELRWFRMARAASGDPGPVSVDPDRIGARRLRVTAELHLTAAEGGATTFPAARPPLSVAPVPGRLVVWFAHQADGQPDGHARRVTEAPVAGERVTLTRRYYLSPAELAAALTRARRATPAPLLAAFAAHFPDPVRVPPDPPERVGAGPRATAVLRSALDLSPPGPGDPPLLVCVVDPEHTAQPTRDRLQAACAARGVGYVEAFAAALDPTSPPLPDGVLLYGAGAGIDAVRVERQLFQPGVVTLYDDPTGPFRVLADQPLAFSRAGLPVPRSLWLRRAVAGELAEVARYLGGFPVVVRVDGGEGGLGVMRADSLPALTSMVEWLTRTGYTPRVVAHVPDALHWRVIVLAGRVLTAYRNPLREGDFRSAPSDDPADYHVTPPPEVARLAIAATRLNGAALAGVDVLTHESGRTYLLEANFPCYFAQAEMTAQVDVAGAILDELLRRRAAPVGLGERWATGAA